MFDEVKNLAHAHKPGGYYRKSHCRGGKRFVLIKSLPNLVKAIKYKSKTTKKVEPSQRPRLKQNLHGPLRPTLLEAAESLRRDLSQTNISRLAKLDLAEFGTGTNATAILESLYRQNADSESRLSKMLTELRFALAKSYSRYINWRELRWQVLERLASIADKPNAVSAFFQAEKYDLARRLPAQMPADLSREHGLVGYTVCGTRHNRRDLSSEITALWDAYKDLICAATDKVYESPKAKGFPKHASYIRDKLSRLRGRDTTKSDISDFVVRVIQGAKQLIAYDLEAQRHHPVANSLVLPANEPPDEVFAA